MDYLITGTDMLKARPNFKLVGRANALNRLCSILIKSKSNSVVVTGAGGVGISSLVLGVQSHKNEPGVQFDILCKRMFWLDTDKLFEFGNREQIVANFNNMMRILNTTPESILVVEDMNGFLEAANNQGCSNFINAFMSSIKAKTNQFIFETRNEHLDQVMKCHSDMLEKITLFDLQEPSNGDLLEIARESAKSLTEWHNIRIDESAITEAVELTTSYRVRDASLSKAQPERSINLLDAALASLRLEAHKVDPDTEAKLKEFHSLQRGSEQKLRDYEEELGNQKNLEKSTSKPNTSVLDDFNAISEGNVKSDEVKLLEKLIKEETLAYQGHTQQFKSLTAKINSNLVLDKAIVQNEFSKISGIPVNKLNEDSRAQLRNLNSDMKGLIFDQDDSIDKICNFIKVAKLDKKNKLPVRILALGPSGVGKSETPRALSQLLQLPLLTFNMADYSEKHSKAKMINCPPGYEGFVAGGGILIEAGRANPTGIFLFDEIEKADPSVFDIFLSVMDNGFLNDNLGREVSFKNCIFVFTSNIGAAHFLAEGEVDPAVALSHAMIDLITPVDQGGGGLRNEFLNRYYGREGIIGYSKLGIPTMEKITLRVFRELEASCKLDDIQLVIGPEVIGEFVKDRYNPVIGARGLPGVISSQVKPIVTNALLSDDFKGGTLDVRYDNKRFVSTYKNKE